MFGSAAENISDLLKDLNLCSRNLEEDDKDDNNMTIELHLGKIYLIFQHNLPTVLAFPGEACDLLCWYQWKIIHAGELAWLCGLAFLCHFP